MKRANLMVVAATVLVAVAWGCGDDPTCVDCCDGDCWDVYRPQTSPENILDNLESSWARGEIERYAALLDPEFRFYFQPGDIPDGLERDYWNRDEDSTGTGALFDAMHSLTIVSKISVDLGAFTVEDSVRVEDPDVKRIRLTHVKLEVEQFNGTTLLVQGDIQDMYFRPGSAAAGTDSTKWYLLEWRDLQGGGGLKPANQASGHALDLARSSPLIQAVTWGRIKSQF